MTELQSIMDWLWVLERETDLRVPAPIPAVGGALVTSVSGPGVPDADVTLLSWVPGIQLRQNRDPAYLELAGQAMAQLHEQASRWTPPESFVRPRWDLDWLLGSSSLLGHPSQVAVLTPADVEILEAASSQLRTDLAGYRAGRESFGVIHADLNLWNVLVAEGGIGIIDFGDCGWGYYLYDVAVMIYSIGYIVGVERPDPEREAALRAAFLDGYCQLRSLGSEQIQLLPAFAAMRNLTIMTFILTSRNQKVQEWGQRRVRTLIADLERYLEGRLLPLS